MPSQKDIYVNVKITDQYIFESFMKEAQDLVDAYDALPKIKKILVGSELKRHVERLKGKALFLQKGNPHAK